MNFLTMLIINTEKEINHTLYFLEQTIERTNKQLMLFLYKSLDIPN